MIECACVVILRNDKRQFQWLAPYERHPVQSVVNYTDLNGAKQSVYAEFIDIGCVVSFIRGTGLKSWQLSVTISEPPPIFPDIDYGDDT